MKKRFGRPLALIVILAVLFIGQESMAATQYHRITWDSAPSSNVIIGFSPDGTSTSPAIRYGFTTDENGWATQSAAAPVTFDIDLTSHFIRLTGLPADSPVYYRVCDQDGCGQRFWFKTAPVDNTPFIAIAGGDTRTGWDTRRAGNALIAKIRPLFIMHGGDYTNSNTASEMSQLLDDWALTYSDDTIDGYPYKRIYPLVPTHGNHENGNYSTLCQVFGVDYREYGTCNENDTYGAFNISPLLRVYTLNSEFRDWGTSHFGDMNSWLNSDLVANGGSATWRFAQYHKPMFPHYTGKSENPDLYAAWADDFFDHALNLSVESDTHMMKVTEALEPSGGDFVDEIDGTSTGGTVYVGEGSWGAPARSADDPKTWTIDLASIQQLKVITVRENRLEVRTAQFDDSAIALTREQRANNPEILPRSIKLWDSNGIGDVMQLVQSTQDRSIIDDLASFTRGCTDTLCGFNDTSHPGVTMESWSWDFGDGTTSTVRNPLHGYTDSGLYNVTLTALDSAGDAHIFGKSVNVKRADDTTIDSQVEGGNDDVEERLSDGNVSMTSTDLELIHENSDQAVGIRFNNITVPQGKTITSAYIRFTADEANTRTTNLVFEAQAHDNAPAFEDVAFDVTNRSMTSASVPWNDVESWDIGITYDSPDLSSVVQEVVDRTGWIAGNSMVFKITGTTDGRRVAESYNGVSASAPILHIEYSEQSTACQANRTILADMWESFSLPCDPGDANKITDVFPSLAIATYNTEYVVWWYDASNHIYHKLPDGNAVLYPGVGYWIYTLIATTMDYTGSPNMTGDLSLFADPTDGVMNYIGHTENASKAWRDIKAANSATLVTIPGADAWEIEGVSSQCSLIPPSNLCLISRTAYVWRSGGWQQMDALVPGLDDDLEVGYSVFVRAFKPGTMLRINDSFTPPAATVKTSVMQTSRLESSNPTVLPRIKTKSKNTGSPWFIRLIAASDHMQDRSNVLGQLNNSIDALDAYEVEEPTPFDSRYLSLTFDNKAFADVTWGYTSDYRAMTKSPGGTWRFLVRASSDVKDITLSWEGDRKLLRSAVLVDEQTGTKVRIKPGQSYTYQNSGKGSYFTFSVGKKSAIR